MPKNTKVTLVSLFEGKSASVLPQLLELAADRATLLGQSLASEKLKVVRLAPIMLSLEPYAFPLPRNDADFRLLVNRALSDIYLTGQVNQIWQQWFGRYEARPSQLLLNVYRLNSLAD